MNSTIVKLYMYSIATLISRECDQLLHSVNNEFGDVDYDCTFAIPYVVRHCKNNSLIEQYGDNAMYLLEMMNIYNSIDGLQQLSPIKLDLLVDNCMISYCKLVNIPYQLIGLERTFNPQSRSFIVSEFQYLGLDEQDISNLDDRSRKWLHDYCIRTNDQYYYNLLQESNYPMNGEINPTYRRMRLMKRFKWIPRIKKMIFNTYRSNYTSSLTILRSPEFDDVWRSLSYREILSDEFDVEHLSSINVQIPHINLVMDGIREKNDISVRDVYLVKKLIQYSTPSEKNIDDIVDRCCVKNSYDAKGRTTLQAIEILLELVRYDKIDLREYQGCHEFLDHLIRIRIGT